MKGIRFQQALPRAISVLVLAVLSLGSARMWATEESEDQAVKAASEVSQAAMAKILATDSNLKRQRGRLLYAGNPFSGVVEHFDPDGTLRSRDCYLDGMRHGANERWFPNGARESIRRYEQNRKHGRHEAWFANGQRKFLSFFDHGKYRGERKEWYVTGDIYAIFQYANGEEVGLQRVWGPNGKLRSNYVVKNGRRYGLIGAKPCVNVPAVEKPGITEVVPNHASLPKVSLVKE